MTYFLGIDGGQSSTKAVIGNDAGRILGAGKAGSCNHVSDDIAEARFREAIGGAVASALHAAELPAATRFSAACCGLSGGPDDKDTLLRSLIKADQYVITNDALIALAGALSGEPGIIVIAGTGSIAWGRNASGKIARAGGWGYVFGDEGSAFDIVRQALRASLQHAEGWGTTTQLHDLLLQATGASTMNTLLHLFYTPEYPRKKIAELGPLVFTAAEQGDAVAQSIILQAAQSLALLASAVRAQIFSEESVAVSYAGGVFRNSSLRAKFQMLIELSGGSRFVTPHFDPAHGALLEAYRTAGLAATIRV